MGERIPKCHPLLGLPGSPTPNYKTCVISANYEPISTATAYNCLTQRIGSHCDTADIVIHSTVYIILVITWSSSDPTVVKIFQQQADREVRRNGGRDKVKICHPPWEG